jgi:predicted ATPase
MASVTAAKMMTVKESPFSNTVPLKASARHIKNNISDQPDKSVFSVAQKIRDNKTQTAARLKKTIKRFFGIIF